MYKVLLVDDEIRIMQWLREAVPWQTLGYEVADICSSGLQALQYLQNHAVDVVLTDIRMPGLNGLELIRRLNETNPQVTTLILSGYNQFEYAQQAIKYGVRGFLLKPIDLEELADLLRFIKKDLSENAAPERDDAIYAQLVERFSSSKIMDVLVYIEKNYNQDISLKSLAERFGFHPAYLGRIFKEDTHCSFNAYLHQKRIAKLKQLLEQTNLPVGQLLESVGYRNYEYFYTIFQKYEKMTFAEYRAKVKKT